MLVDLLLLSFGCLVTVNILLLFLTVPWFGLVVVVCPDHTHLIFGILICSMVIRLLYYLYAFLLFFFLLLIDFSFLCYDKSRKLSEKDRTCLMATLL